MGGFLYNCPLCCDRTFSSKQSLFEHLTSILENVYCPVCNNKWTSVVHLIEHLSLDNCQPDVPISQRILFDETSQENDISNSTEIQNTDTKVFQNVSENITQNNTEGDFSSIHTYEAQVDNTDVSKMYVELLDKQSCLQTQEIKLVKDGQSYMIMTQGDMDLSTGGTIVTKQNSDGTISLTTVDDMKIADKETEEITEEIYSCNTCKVSFSSVAEHIQTYHNDQDVVVEEPLDDDGCSVPVEFESLESDNTQDQLTSGDKQHPRRVITDTGDIVEEPLSYKSADTVVQQKTIDKATNKAKDASKVKERVTTKRLLQKDKLCDSMVKVIKQEEKDGSYHKVIVKELQGQNGSKKLYHCLSCDFSAGNLNEFKNRACKALKYPCLHCPVAYDNSKSLCAHMKVHKAKPEDIEPVSQLYACEICTTIFPSNKSLKLHKRMHDPVKARPIEPPVVNVDGSEVSEGRFKCNVCDKLIPVDYRTIHQNSHITSDKMNCSICNKKFSSVEYLEMHMNVHNIDKVTINKQDQSLPYHCLYCERRFARPHEKVKHERIHTGEKPHSCEICGKSFRVSYCLTLHMRTHTGARPYGCPLCGKRFKAHSVYNHHLLTHSEVRAYKCPYCPKAFKTSVQLAGHKNSHTKPFSCQHCNRPFASLYAVRVHTETHARQNNLKFSCSLCGASYARAFALKDHVKQVHKQELEDLQNNQDEEWIGSEKVETEGIPDINEHDDLQNEMTDMSASNELIVP